MAQQARPKLIGQIEFLPRPVHGFVERGQNKPSEAAAARLATRIVVHAREELRGAAGPYGAISIPSIFARCAADPAIHVESNHPAVRCPPRPLRDSSRARRRAHAESKRDYWDIWGRHHQTTVEAKQAILRVARRGHRKRGRTGRGAGGHGSTPSGQRLAPPLCSRSVITSDNTRASAPAPAARWANAEVEDPPRAIYGELPKPIPSDGSPHMGARPGRFRCRPAARAITISQPGLPGRAPNPASSYSRARIRSRPGLRRPRGWSRGEPVWRAHRAQLGLRRFSRPAGRGRLGGRRARRQLRLLQPAARHS